MGMSRIAASGVDIEKRYKEYACYTVWVCAFMWKIGMPGICFNVVLFEKHPMRIVNAVPEAVLVGQYFSSALFPGCKSMKEELPILLSIRFSPSCYSRSSMSVHYVLCWLKQLNTTTKILPHEAPI